MAGEQTYVWSRRIPGAVQGASILFILVSLIYGSGAIFAALGSPFGYAYWVLGIVLIALLAISIAASVAKAPPPR